MSYSDYYKNKKSCLTENDKNFIYWMDKIEKIVKRKTGCDLLDLPDEQYMISFERGINYKNMANIVINNFNKF